MSEMSSPAMKQPTPSIPPASAATTISSPKKKGKKLNLFSHIKYEHMAAGISGKNDYLRIHLSIFDNINHRLGGVTSTLLLHPLDLIKIRFAGEYIKYLIVCSWLRSQVYQSHNKHENKPLNLFTIATLNFDSALKCKFFPSPSPLPRTTSGKEIVQKSESKQLSESKPVFMQVTFSMFSLPHSVMRLCANLHSALPLCEPLSRQLLCTNEAKKSLNAAMNYLAERLLVSHFYGFAFQSKRVWWYAVVGDILAVVQK